MDGYMKRRVARHLAVSRWGGSQVGSWRQQSARFLLPSSCPIVLHAVRSVRHILTDVYEFVWGMRGCCEWEKWIVDTARLLDRFFGRNLKDPFLKYVIERQRFEDRSWYKIRYKLRINIKEAYRQVIGQKNVPIYSSGHHVISTSA